MKKKFDCIAMKRRGAEKVYQQIAGMTIEEELTFWQQRTAVLKQKQRAVRNRRATSRHARSHSNLVPQSRTQ